jgi:phage shock protein B
MEEALAIMAIFIGLPWIVLHYITKWKTSASLTMDDEQLLEELYQLARRLDDRMETVERLVASDNPDFRADYRREYGETGAQRGLPEREIDDAPLRELDRMMAEKKGEKL